MKKSKVKPVLRSTYKMNQALQTLLTAQVVKTVYLVEIPYRASNDGYKSLVKFTSADQTANISLKGIFPHEGGMPGAPDLSTKLAFMDIF